MNLLIIMNGGLIQGIESDEDPANVPNIYVVDYDIDGAAPEELTKNCDGTDCYFFDHPVMKMDSIETAWLKEKSK